MRNFNRRRNATMIIRSRGWNQANIFRMRLYAMASDGIVDYVDIYGVEFGPTSFMWNNPFAKDGEVTPL
jgi:hypothetical protein